MSIFLILVFVVGYAFIAFEHPLQLDKAASALLTGVLCWVVLLVGFDSMPAFVNSAISINKNELLDSALLHHLSEIASILFFLIGAMTIVELVDVHDGFKVITDRIETTDKVALLWITCWVSFFLSAVLDNMTTAIIMCALLRKIMKGKENIWLFGGFVVMACNAGGAWSPIGDVTTIMLWIGGQVTTFPIMKSIFLPSIISLLVPLLFATFKYRGQSIEPNKIDDNDKKGEHETTSFERNAVFVLGIIGLLFVPIFKTITHYPPFMGIMLSVGVIWYATEFLHRSKAHEVKHNFSVAHMLHRIDIPSVLFFLGILLAVAALNTSGHLTQMATILNTTFGNIYIINTIIGLLSAIVDNVPLVAAAMGMYSLETFPQNHDFWNLLAFCAGTGGSILIIGSAAGVASMSILKIDFLWYLKKISLYAAIGYFSGILVYYFMN